jgi:hypothetical protein
MIVVEAGHAYVIKFLPLSCELSIFVAVTLIHFLVKSAMMRILFLFFLNYRLCPKIQVVLQPILKILSYFVPNLTPMLCERCVLTIHIIHIIHIILMFVIWSGNHKFYIQFLRLLG